MFSDHQKLSDAFYLQVVAMATCGLIKIWAGTLWLLRTHIQTMLAVVDPVTRSSAPMLQSRMDMARPSTAAMSVKTVFTP